MKKTEQPNNMMPLILMAVLAYLAFSGGCPVVEPVDPDNPIVVVDPAGIDKVVYVYESEGGSRPIHLFDAFNQLNEMGIETRAADDDETTGLDQIPEDTKPAIIVAREKGIPELVFLNGSTVVKTMELPDTAEAIVAEVK